LEKLARESTLASYRKLVEKSEASVDSDSNWMITLSDVMSLLLIFFIMFFIIIKQNVQPVEVQTDKVPETEAHGASILPDADAVGKKIRDEINVDINNLAMGDQISVLVNKREVIITMKEKVTFRPGEADILKRSEPVLETIAGIIQRYPDFLVEIDGHTDNVPISTRLYPSNWELSVVRAASVLKYFINNHAIDPSRLSIRGNADQKPLAPNNTPENRAQNRRVEIRLKKTEA
jgi:chemotaxis protein MotB